MSKRPAPEDETLAAVRPSGLKVLRVLKSDPDTKFAFVLCEEPASKSQAVVVLSRREWTDADVKATLEGGDTALDEFHRNDKFSKYSAQPPPSANAVSVTLICPANEIDVAKYSDQRRRLVRETPDVYARATLPFVESLPAKQTAWVRACLAKEKEAERLIYEDEHCMLFPDTKWDLRDTKSLYTLALLKDTSLRSVRDFTGEHVDGLVHLRDGIYAKLEQTYGISPDQLRAYVHYLPSFWMAHIHFAAITCPGAGASTFVGKAILLDDIIDSLRRDPNHFKTANLSFVVGERDPLHTRLVEAGVLTPLPLLPA